MVIWWPFRLAGFLPTSIYTALPESSRRGPEAVPTHLGLSLVQVSTVQSCVEFVRNRCPLRPGHAKFVKSVFCACRAELMPGSKGLACTCVSSPRFFVALTLSCPWDISLTEKGTACPNTEGSLDLGTDGSFFHITPVDSLKHGCLLGNRTLGDNPLTCVNTCETITVV